MQLTRCPICHSRIHLDALIQDSAGRDLLALIAKLDRQLAMPLVTYIGLFRSNKRDLANDRAYRLASDVLSLGEGAALTIALSQTTEQMRNKAALGQFKPLSNHNYLKRVLEDTVLVPEVLVGVMPASGSMVISKADKRRQVTATVLDLNNTDW